MHTVYLEAFYIDKYPVTNNQYKTFIDANPQWHKHHIQKGYHNGNYLRHWKGNTYPNGEADHPVVNVSWYAAMAYAEWMEKRLPTEAEWERAARGGVEGKKYPWGDTIAPTLANYDWNVGEITPVGNYPENGYGLHDVCGNVWEWCFDVYDADFYISAARQNPISGVNIVERVIDHTINDKWREYCEGVHGAFKMHSFGSLIAMRKFQHSHLMSSVFVAPNRLRCKSVTSTRFLRCL